jgi:hypothetical protein
MRCVPETAGRRRREAARWSDEAEAAAAAAKGRGRRRRAIVARDLEKTRSTAGGGIERLLALSCHQGSRLGSVWAVSVPARRGRSRVAKVGNF